MIVIWALIAGFGMGIGVWGIVDRLARWDADRRLAAQLAAAAAVRGRHAMAGAGAPPWHDRLDELIDGQTYADEVAPVTGDPAAAAFARPSRMLPAELRPLPMWDGSGQGLHDIDVPRIRQDVGGWLSGACL